ncbi:40622_t:CDS:1, partial [Gigaspora margarita]
MNRNFFIFILLAILPLANANNYETCSTLPLTFSTSAVLNANFDPDPVSNQGYITFNTHHNLSADGFFVTDVTQIEYLYSSDSGQYAATVVHKVRDVGAAVVDQTDNIGFDSGLTPPFQIIVILSESLPYYVHGC